ncbi:DUF952 domain-containing protein [Streptomyces sp. NPDC050433]|uniref:DUF952 domain-containing protein n=1 Tax=unclassified Streptomyces TaxID=2593676 RepID=UPI003412F22B
MGRSGECTGVDAADPVLSGYNRLMLYHFAVLDNWLADPDRPYAPPSLASDGSVHCSPTEAAVLKAVARFHQETAGLVLVIDEARVDVPVDWVPPPAHSPMADQPGFRMARLRGPLNRDAVVQLMDAVRTDDDQGWELVARDGSATR